MRKTFEYFGWVALFIFAVPLTPLGWMQDALGLEPVEWLAALCGMALVFAYVVCKGEPERR